MRAKVNEAFGLDCMNYDQGLPDGWRSESLLSEALSKLHYVYMLDDAAEEVPLEITEREVERDLAEKRDIIRLLKKKGRIPTRSSIRLLRSLRAHHISKSGKEMGSIYSNVQLGYSVNLNTGFCSRAVIANDPTPFSIGWKAAIKDLLDSGKSTGLVDDMILKHFSTVG